VLLRWGLIHQGGTLYIPDEQYRFVRCYQLLFAVQAGDWAGAVAAVTHPDHTLFALVGAGPALIHCALARWFGWNLDTSDWFPASLFALASVFNIYLTWLLALRCGARREEARLVSLLMACSVSMLFYARHLLPYDIVMAMALIAANLAAPRSAGVRPCAAAGALLALSVLTYYGNWPLVAAVIALIAWRSRRGAWRARLAATLGGAAAVGAAFLIAVLALAGPAFFSQAHVFSENVIQGDYAEGWSHPWAYLWYCEHVMLLVWVAGALLCLRRRTGYGWLIGAGVVYGLLCLTSTVLHRFVTEGRFDRLMVPFLCLACAHGLYPLMRRQPRLFSGVAWIAICQAGFTFSVLYGLHFPREVRAQVLREHPDVRYAWNITGVPPKGDPKARYVLLDTSMMYPIQPQAPVPAGRVLFSLPHPEQAFLPYQYEHYSPAEREILRHTDISMRLIDTAPDTSKP
jgi:hypothetical protein